MKSLYINKLKDIWKPYGLNILLIDDICSPDSLIFYISVPKMINGAREEVNKTRGINLVNLFKEKLVEDGFKANGKSKVSVKYAEYDSDNIEITHNEWIDS